ncbi:MULTISPECIES: hypothetical protein [Pseudomonas]|nr:MULTISPECIES: hypothetical protein [Pseudomonas]
MDEVLLKQRARNELTQKTVGSAVSFLQFPPSVPDSIATGLSALT